MRYLIHNSFKGYLVTFPVIYSYFTFSNKTETHKNSHQSIAVTNILTKCSRPIITSNKSKMTCDSHNTAIWRCFRWWWESIKKTIFFRGSNIHYDDVIMTTMASQIHQPRGCLLNRLFRRRSKITSKLRVTGHCAGKSPGPVNSPHKGPVTRKMLPLDDVIMT